MGLHRPTERIPLLSSGLIVLNTHIKHPAIVLIGVDVSVLGEVLVEEELIEALLFFFLFSVIVSRVLPV